MYVCLYISNHLATKRRESFLEKNNSFFIKKKDNNFVIYRGFKKAF